MSHILLAILSDHMPEKAIAAAAESAGEEGEVLLLRIFPTVITEGFADVEEHGKDVKRSLREKARASLSQGVEYGKNSWRGEKPPRFDTLVREGAPLDVISSFAQSAKPDMIIMAEKDSNRYGSFASGDLVSAIRKKTGIPLRVVG